MNGARKGLFVSIDGPSGVGKSTTIRELRAALHARGTAAQWTVEPPAGDFLGDFTRTHGGQLHGMALACPLQPPGTGTSRPPSPRPSPAVTC
ncbi:hypothetical protein [Streptomyces viridosporus]|uniref:hypothetical protein n=1 Tax=Streptomyces viridosporus TaxID=67581 RepID=UPI0033262B0E